MKFFVEVLYKCLVVDDYAWNFSLPLMVNDIVSAQVLFLSSHILPLPPVILNSPQNIFSSVEKSYVN